MIRFKINASQLDEALGIVSIVPPRAVTPQGGAGYLFVIQGSEAHVYSRDATHASRVTVPIEEAEGEGAFIYPAKHIGAFKFLGEEMVTLTATSEGDVHRVTYSTASGAGSERSTYDPRLMAPLDKDLGAAKDERTFSTALLKEALNQAKAFLPKPNDAGVKDEAYKAMQLFDGKAPVGDKGNGYLYATNGTLALFFRSDDLYDKGLHVHGQHVPMLTAFLGKAGPKVTVKEGAGMTFVTDEQGRVFGWAHFVKKHSVFSYYTTANDTWVAKVPPGVVLNALRYLRSEMDSKLHKIRVKFSPEEKQLSFAAVGGTEKATSFPVPVEVEGEPGEWSAAFNIDSLLELFSGIKGNELEMRAYLVAPSETRPRGMVMFRTVDVFVLDNEGKVIGGSGVEKVPEGAHPCRVTRFLTSMD